MSSCDIQAIIFDLEDTLVDREKSRMKFLEEQFERFHELMVTVQRRDFEKVYFSLNPYGLEDMEWVYQELVKRLNIERISWKTFYNDYHMHHYRYHFSFHDTLFTLDKLRQMGYKLGVIANGKTDEIAHVLNAIGVDPYIHYVSTSEEVGAKKPDPKIFEDNMKHLGVTAEHVLYVGDCPLNDVAAAHAMGMTSVWIANAVIGTPEDDELDYTIESLSDLIEICKKIKRGEAQ
nr:HAD family hydrolase [Mammaliicoccus sp. Marseille-Q6498]